VIRQCRNILVSILLLGLGPLAFAQSAMVQGQISDTSGAVISKAYVRVVNQQTGTELHATTNVSGQYSVPALEPGLYKIFVHASGFSTAVSNVLTLNVAQNAVMDFKLRVGSGSVEVTVNADNIAINTTDATVGTVIDRQFVENMPLNGRSFQSLILLSPGVVTASPQGTDNSGEFSVNGQRTASNNFNMDGASAMNTASNGSGSNTTGSASSRTALGTTQAIVSVDALQEFRIATSTYSAEYGRGAGAQVSFTSRSGTKQYHGTAFDYLRNYAFDANNWFNDYSATPLPKPTERQNDFGGTLGGPLSVPRLFPLKDRAFFFFSYEGLRLNQPVPSTIHYVPSNGTYNTATYSNPLAKNLRANAPAALQPVLNGFPLPNCTVAQNAQCVDYGDGLSPSIMSTTLPSNIDTVSARFDIHLWPWLRVFARYSDTESNAATIIDGANTANTVSRNRIYLLGVDSVFHGSMTNELRLQYSPAYYAVSSTGHSIGGSIPVTGPTGPNLQTMQGLPPAGGLTEFQLLFANEQSITKRPLLYDTNSGSRQFQPNIVDTLTWMHRHHLFKAGVNYRQTTSYFGDGYLSSSPTVLYYYVNATEVLGNTIYEVSSHTFQRQDTIAKNLGIFFQDEWRLTPKVSLSSGLRWDFSPPTKISGAQQYTYTGDITNPSSLALAPLGTPLYKTTYTNIAPRLGVAVIIHNQPGHELVLRAGGGLFYDTGQSSFSGTVSGLGSGQTTTLFNADAGAFPLATSTILKPFDGTLATPYSLSWIVDPHFVPPSTVQWSASLEQAIGSGQSVTFGYVGSAGRNLSTYLEYNIGTFTNHEFSTISQYQNGPGSKYNALQLQYKRQMKRGLQVVANYTWAHSIDWASTDQNGTSTNYIDELQRGNSDHDVRHNFTMALSYKIPSRYTSRWQRAILGKWSTDLWFVARSAFPVQLLGPVVFDPASGAEVATRLNYNGENPYVYKPGIPGHRQFNPAVFSVPDSSQVGLGNAPRNFLRGFGENEADLDITRTFPIYRTYQLQFRTEAFNIFNHPNFGALNVDCGATTSGAVCSNSIMGQASGTLSSASLGGLSSLYQHGGPRSLQLELKLQF